MALTDNELVMRCLQQDEYAWQLLVERHSHRILNIAFQFTGRREEAEDLAQEIFLRVYRSLRRFDLTTSFLPWLVRVSRNLCIDEYRSRARERASLVGEEPDPERTADPKTRPAEQPGGQRARTTRPEGAGKAAGGTENGPDTQGSAGAFLHGDCGGAGAA